MQHLLRERAALTPDDLEYVVQAIDKLKDERLKACVAELIGLFTSLVLSTLPSPTIDLEMPATVPVNVGLSIGAFASRAV